MKVVCLNGLGTRVPTSDLVSFCEMVSKLDAKLGALSSSEYEIFVPIFISKKMYDSVEGDEIQKKITLTEADIFLRRGFKVSTNVYYVVFEVEDHTTDMNQILHTLSTEDPLFVLSASDKRPNFEFDKILVFNGVLSGLRAEYVGQSFGASFNHYLSDIFGVAKEGEQVLDKVVNPVGSEDEVSVLVTSSLYLTFVFNYTSFTALLENLTSKGEEVRFEMEHCTNQAIAQFAIESLKTRYLDHNNKVKTSYL